MSRPRLACLLLGDLASAALGLSVSRLRDSLLLAKPGGAVLLFLRRYGVALKTSGRRSVNAIFAMFCDI